MRSNSRSETKRLSKQGTAVFQYLTVIFEIFKAIQDIVSVLGCIILLGFTNCSWKTIVLDEYEQTIDKNLWQVNWFVEQV